MIAYVFIDNDIFKDLEKDLEYAKEIKDEIEIAHLEDISSDLHLYEKGYQTVNSLEELGELIYWLGYVLNLTVKVDYVQSKSHPENNHFELSVSW